MKLFVLLISILHLFFPQGPVVDLNFEKFSDTTSLLSEWSQISNDQCVALLKSEGKNNFLSISRAEDNGCYNYFSGVEYVIRNEYKGRRIKLSGRVKANNIQNGHTGLLMSLKLKSGAHVQFEEMEEEYVSGNTEWKQYEIDCLLDHDVATIHVGAYLNGSGEALIDDLQLSIDGELISAPAAKIELPAVETEPILLTNAQYLDLKSGTYKKGKILLENNKIKAIYPQDSDFVHPNKFDASDYYILPGLVDAHIHLFQSGGIYTRPDALDLTEYRSYGEERQWLKDNAGDLLQRYLKAGITTVVDIGGPMYNYAIRDKFANDPDYPNVFLTGPLVSTYQPDAFIVDDPPIVKVNNKEEAIALVQEQLPYKPDFIKIWGIPLPTLKSGELLGIIEATIQESKKNDLRVMVHATELNTAKLAVKLGANVLVHSVSNAIDKEFTDMLKANNVVYIPTFVVSRNYSRTFAADFVPTTEDYQISNPFVLGEIFDVDHLTEVEDLHRRKAMYPQAKERLQEFVEIQGKNMMKVFESGNTIATGTDAGNIGTLHASSYFDEIAAMSKAGLSNLEIIKASTINGAKVLAKEAEMGSIEEGKLADLVLYKNDPLQDLNHIKNPEIVFKSGKMHHTSNIIKITPEVLAQQQLNAYNAGDIDAFLEPYAEDVEIYNFPNELQSKGKDAIRPAYASMFERNPDLHCELVNRIVQGNTVIDQERVTGIKGIEVLEAIAIYEIENDKIAKVYFIQE